MLRSQHGVALAVSSQAGQTLMRRQKTRDILALVRVLVDSSDTLAFGALMRGPLVERPLCANSSHLLREAKQPASAPLGGRPDSTLI